jgi:hypothetical protein
MNILFHAELSLEIRFNLQPKNFFHITSFLVYNKALVTVISHTVTETERITQLRYIRMDLWIECEKLRIGNTRNSSSLQRFSVVFHCNKTVKACSSILRSPVIWSVLFLVMKNWDAFILLRSWVLRKLFIFLFMFCTSLFLMITYSLFGTLAQLKDSKLHILVFFMCGWM